MYIFVETGEYPIPFEWIRENHRNISFPDDIDNKFVEHLGYAQVIPSAPPIFNVETQKCVELKPDNVDGVWRQRFTVENLDAAELEIRKEEFFQYNSQRVRAERGQRLAATDYLMASDYPINDDIRTAVAGYRQALRDLPQAEGFPWDGGDGVPWPIMPSLRAKSTV